MSDFEWYGTILAPYGTIYIVGSIIYFRMTSDNVRLAFTSEPCHALSVLSLINFSLYFRARR